VSGHRRGRVEIRRVAEILPASTDAKKYTPRKMSSTGVMKTTFLFSSNPGRCGKSCFPIFVNSLCFTGKIFAGFFVGVRALAFFDFSYSRSG
jgi:hypothetical protein